MRLNVTARTAFRRVLLVALCAAGVVPAAAARGSEIEITAIGGAQLPGNVSTETGTLDLHGGALFGAAVGFRVRPDGIVEVSWNHQKATADGFVAGAPVRFDASIDTVELGGIWETELGATRPFLGAAIGGTRLGGPGQDTLDGWALSGSFYGGLRIRLGAHALLRLEGRIGGALVSDRTVVTCSSLPGECSVTITGSGIGLTSLRAGLAARF